MEERHDPDTYMRLLQPRPPEEVAAASKAFMDELMALRVKHGVCDLSFIFAVAVDTGEPTPEGTIAMVASHGHYGNYNNALPFAAALFRTCRENAKTAVAAEADAMVADAVDEGDTGETKGGEG